MALTKYAFWDFSDGGLTPKICHSDEAGFNLLKRGTLTFSEDHLVDRGNGLLITQFGAGQGPFCNDDVMCFRLIFSTTQLQESYIFCYGVNNDLYPFPVQITSSGKIRDYFTWGGPPNTYKADGTKNDLRIIVDRVTSKVTYNLNGVEAITSRSVEKNGSCPNICFGGVDQFGTLRTPFRGNMYAAWYADDPSGLDIEPKVLFKKDSNYYKFNLITKSMEAIGTAVTEQDFKDYGIQGFSSAEIDNLIFKDFKPVLYMPSNLSMNTQFNFKPKKVLIKGKDDILLNSKQIKKIEAFTASITTSGAGKVRMVFSNDSGVTWKKYNPLTLATEDVAIGVDSVLLNGNTVDEINTIPSDTWQAINVNQKIRFAYAISKDAYSDIAKVDKLSMKADIWGYLSEYRNAETRLRNGYSEVVIPEIGTYVVTYL